MSDFPEHDKLHAVADETQAIGEFLDWLANQGVHLMVWREDLTDTRPTDDECRERLDSDHSRPCDQTRHRDGDTGIAWWRRHCLHWQNPEREAEGVAEQGRCCRCGRGHVYEITGIKSWVSEPRTTLRLLADWAGIDENKLEAEKRQILAALRVPAPATEGNDTNE